MQRSSHQAVHDGVLCLEEEATFQFYPFCDFSQGPAANLTQRGVSSRKDSTPKIGI